MSIQARVITTKKTCVVTSTLSGYQLTAKHVQAACDGDTLIDVIRTVMLRFDPTTTVDRFLLAPTSVSESIMVTITPRGLDPITLDHFPNLYSPLSRNPNHHFASCTGSDCKTCAYIEHLMKTPVTAAEIMAQIR